MSPRSTAGTRREEPFGITSIAISGYKSLGEEYALEIRPLTLLAGANSSGKSSVMQPLLLLKQTLEVVYDPGPLLLDGPNVRFTSTEQMLSKIPGKRPSKYFVIKLCIHEDRFLELYFQKQNGGGIKIVKISHSLQEEKITLYPEMSHEEILETLPHFFSKPQDRRWKIDRIRCFLGVSGQTIRENGAGSITETMRFSEECELHLRGLIHVPGLRGNPERTYKTTAVGRTFPGTFENYVASIISHWQRARDPRLKELGKSLELLGLTWKVEARHIDDVHVELQVGRFPHRARGKTKDTVSIADVGFGVSQTLPVLVALLTAEPGQLVYLEQPEIHLHPRAQIALARVLANAAERGVRVVAETHSALLLLAVQTLVAEGHFDPQKVKLHWFARGDDGLTKITSADLDDMGAFGDWPEDFADVALGVESRYLDAVEQRQGR